MADKFLIETSARHVHLSEEHIEVLFGKGVGLTHKKDRRSRTLSFSDPLVLHLRSRYRLPTLVRSELQLPYARAEMLPELPVASW